MDLSIKREKIDTDEAYERNNITNAFDSISVRKTSVLRLRGSPWRIERAKTEAARLRLTATKPFSPPSKHGPAPFSSGECECVLAHLRMRPYHVCPKLTSSNIPLRIAQNQIPS